MIKKVILILFVAIFLSGSLPFITFEKTAYAQPDPRGAQAASVEWIRNLAFEILNLYLARSWPIDLLDRDPAWRPQQVHDEDGRDRLDTRQRLLRWDRRPPNEVLVNGFIPQVSNENPSQQDTDLFGYVKSNTPSVFVSTTKTKFKGGKRYQPWTPRSSARGIIYQYEIFAPGGIDVNNSFGDRSPWPNQYEVAFPGGIRPEFIRSVRELEGGRIQRIWINPYFLDPGELEGISASSRTELVNWEPNHPDGNHQDSNETRSFNPDDDMYGRDGVVPDEEDIPVFNGPGVLPDGEYQIKNRKDENVLADLSSNQNGAIVHAYQNYGLNNQKWNFVYNSTKQAYKISSSQNPNLFLTWPYYFIPTEISYGISGTVETGDDNQYWRIEQTSDGYYQLRSLRDLKMVLDLENGNTSNGTPLYAWSENGAPSQEWIIEKTHYIPLKDGQYQISSSLDQNKVARLGVPEHNGAPVSISQNHQIISQRWNFTYNGARQAYKITSPNTPSLAFAWDSNNFSGKIVGHDGDSDDQYWRIEQTKDGYYKLRNYKDTSMVLDLPNSNPIDGNQLQVFEDNGTGAQKWGITPVIHQTIEDGEYQIASSIAPNQVADLTSDEKVVTYDNHYGKNQMWKFTFDHNRQAYRVKSVDKPDLAFAWDSNHSGKIVGHDGDYDDQYWRVVKTSDGYFTLRNYKDPGMVLDVPNSTPNNDVQLQAYEDNGTNAQKWFLHRVDAPIIPNGTYNISSKLDYKKVIDHKTDSHEAIIWQFMNLVEQDWKFEYDSTKKAYKIYNGYAQNLGLYYQGSGLNVAVENLDTPPDNNELRKFWIVEYDNGKGGYLIRSAYDPTQVIDLANSDLSNGNKIITYQPSFNKNQMWNLIPRIN